MPRSISRLVLWYSLLAVTAADGGCQRRQTWDLAPVEGTVTKGGRPLANVQVIFLADADASTQGPRASGITDESGHYRLRTDNGEGGAVVGKHRVVLLDPTIREGRLGRAPREFQLKEAEKAKNTPELPSCYRLFHETPLRAEVHHPGPQTLNFDIP